MVSKATIKRHLAAWSSLNRQCIALLIAGASACLAVWLWADCVYCSRILATASILFFTLAGLGQAVFLHRSIRQLTSTTAGGFVPTTAGNTQPRNLFSPTGIPSTPLHAPGKGIAGGRFAAGIDDNPLARQALAAIAATPTQPTICVVGSSKLCTALQPVATPVHVTPERLYLLDNPDAAAIIVSAVCAGPWNKAFAVSNRKTRRFLPQALQQARQRGVAIILQLEDDTPRLSPLLAACVKSAHLVLRGQAVDLGFSDVEAPDVDLAWIRILGDEAS